MPRIVAGSIGSIVTALAVTPLEVVKVRQQTAPPKATTVRPCPSCGIFVLNNGLMECIVPRKSVPYVDKPKVIGNLGTFGTLRQIFVKEGIVGIYAGLAPTLVMSVPNTVLYFTSYDELSAQLRRSQGGDRFWIPLASGSLARLLASMATAPLELIRTRQAMLGGSSSSSMVAEIRELIRHDGVPALFKGLTPTLWRDVPFSAIYWFCLEHFKGKWKERNEECQVPPLQHAGQSFLSGATAGMIAAACTTPFDVVKTRQQVKAPVSTEVVCHHNGAIVAPSSTMGIIRQVVEEEGLAGLWRGNTTRIIKVAPACAIMISCYELGKVLLS